MKKSLKKKQKTKKLKKIVKKVSSKKSKKSIKKVVKNKKKVVHKKATKPTQPKKKELHIPETFKEKPVPNVYFTKDTEQSILAYNESDVQIEKDKIYNEKIRYAFEKIAENIYNKYGFSYSDVHPLEVQKMAVSHMVANMDKYDASKGKAFSYFSIVAKNWFILNNNNTYRRFTTQVEICEQPGDSGEFIVESEHHSRESDLKEFVKLMVDFWDQNVDKIFLKDRDRKIASAVVDIFRYSDKIEHFNKKALYVCIRDLSDHCPTQHITKIVNKMKVLQKNIYLEYINTGIVTGNKTYYTAK